MYWYYFLHQAYRYDPLAFERDLKCERVPNMMAEPTQFVGMLTSLPMKSWHVTSIPPPPWLDKIVPSWKSYGKSKLLRGRSVGTSVSGIGRSKASRSTLADGWCLCNLHRWHIGWWVGAKRCSASRCKAHRTHLIIIIYCKGRKFLPLKLSKVLK